MPVSSRILLTRLFCLSPFVQSLGSLQPGAVFQPQSICTVSWGQKSSLIIFYSFTFQVKIKGPPPLKQPGPERFRLLFLLVKVVILSRGEPSGRQTVNNFPILSQRVTEVPQKMRNRTTPCSPDWPARRSLSGTSQRGLHVSACWAVYNS